MVDKSSVSSATEDVAEEFNTEVVAIEAVALANNGIVALPN